MDLLRILICASLVVYGNCVDDEDITVTSHDKSTTLETSADLTSVSDTDAIETLSTTSLASSTGTGNDEDIIIYTVTKDNSSDHSTTESAPSSTVYDDDSAEVITVTTAEDKEANETACWINPCRNGGTCIDDSTDPSLFNCSCPEGYEGLRCGTQYKCELNEDGTECKNGACVRTKDDLVRYCRCFQGEYWDQESKECRESELPCFPNPCLNGGTCSVQEDGKPHCDCSAGFEGKNCTVQNRCGACKGGYCSYDDTLTAKYCKCREGMYWNEETGSCEAISLPCRPDPCENGGTCIPVTEADFNCSCSEGFSGTSCEVVDKCSSDENCGGHGECTITEEGRMRTCQCEEGYYLKKQAHTCDKIVKPCHPNPCLHDGICTALTESNFNCKCTEGYTGTDCSTRDMCEMDGGKAFCTGANCTDVKDLDVYFCTCMDGQYFDYTRRECIELDLCPLMRCDATENCAQGKCKCQDNFQRNNSTGKCEPDFCSTNPCPALDMKCEEGSGSADYKCSCEDGYAFNGTHCVEPWCAFPSLNQCGQQCHTMGNAYECDCEESFELKEDNRTCSYVGISNSTCSNKTCEKGSCMVDDGTETCICPNGYTEVDGNCIDVCSVGEMPEGVCPEDECETKPEDGFRCRCEGKYALAMDKTTCNVRTVCQENEVGWKSCASLNAKCVPNWKKQVGYECDCMDGKIETPGGICRDVCDIESNQRLCSLKGATCDVDVDGKRTCKCPPYFKANEQGEVCNRPADYSYLVTLPLDETTYKKENPKQRSLDTSLDYRKISKDITLTAQKLFIGFSQANILTCSPRQDYIICKVEVQFSMVQESDLRRLKIDKMCLSKDGSNKCILPPSLVLAKDKITKDVDIKPTDPCDDDIKEENCGSETICTSSPYSRDFNCSCKPGLSMRRRIYPFGSIKSYVEICRDIDECVEGNPCPPNSNCMNTIGSFLCSCKSGFRRVRDSGDKCIEICNPNPCTHGQCGTRGDHEFDCTCDAGYRGALCNLRDQNFKRARTNTVIVGVVLGGILLITVILFAVCISRFRKRKSYDEPGHMLYSSAEMTERRRVDGGVINNAFRRE